MGADRRLADRSVSDGPLVVGNDELGGVGGGHIGVERLDSEDRADSADELRHDVTGHRGGRDPGERVREHAPHGDRGVGEAGRACEEVGSADVRADRGRGGAQAFGAREREITSSSPTVAITSLNRCAGEARWCVEMLTAASANMPLATIAPSTQPATWTGM